MAELAPSQSDIKQSAVQASDMRQKGITAFLVALILGAGTYFLFSTDSDQQENTVRQDAAPTEQADLFAQNVTFDQLNADGTLNYRLVAASITQYPANERAAERTELDQPNFHLVNQEDPPWDISSEHGELRLLEHDDAEAEEILYLTKNVVMHQIHPINGELTIRSDSFTIFPQREFAETEDDVIIDSKVGRTEAAGMRADLSGGVMSLTSSPEQGQPVTSGGAEIGEDPATFPRIKRVHTVILPEQFK